MRIIFLGDDEENPELTQKSAAPSNTTIYETEVDRNIIDGFNFQLKSGKTQNKILPGKGWSDVAYKIIFDTTKVKCPFSLSFKNKKTIAAGHCPDDKCNSTVEMDLVAWCDKKVKLEIRLNDYNENQIHTRTNRRIRYKLREDYAEQLTHTNPFKLHNQLGTENWRDGNTFYPPHLPKLATLQAISSENQLSQSEVVKQIFEFNARENIMKSFQLCPEVVLSFWHNLQQNYYKNFSANNYTIIAIDDTGNLVYNLHGNANSTNEINLFQLQLQSVDSKPTIPMGQLLSSRKNSATIIEFLTIWLNDFKNPPNECVMDGAGALHIAVCRVFNKMELSEYYQICWRFINGLDKKFNLKTLIRMDGFHFIAMVKRFFGKNKLDGSAKTLLLRAILLCVPQVDFTTIFQVFACVILIASATKETKESLASKSILTKFVQSEKVEASIPVNIEICAEQQWAAILITKINDMKFKKSAIDNTSYFPELVEYLKYLGPLVCMWSNIVPHKVGSKQKVASSNIIEAGFSTIKNNMLEQEPTTVDKFLELNLQMIINKLNGLKGIKQQTVIKTIK